MDQTQMTQSHHLKAKNANVCSSPASYWSPLTMVKDGKLFPFGFENWTINLSIYLHLFWQWQLIFSPKSKVVLFFCWVWFSESVDTADILHDKRKKTNKSALWHLKWSCLDLNAVVFLAHWVWGSECCNTQHNWENNEGTKKLKMTKAESPFQLYRISTASPLRITQTILHWIKPQLFTNSNSVHSLKKQRDFYQ